MKPQTGDIWRYRSPNTDWGDSIVLLHEMLRDGPSHFSLKPEVTFWGYDLVNDQYDEYFFNEMNMEHWEKLA